MVFENPAQRGIQRYFRELLPRLGGPVTTDILLRGPASGGLPAGCRELRLSRPWSHARNPVLRRLGRRLPERGWKSVCSGHDLFHSSFYSAPPVVGLREVVTVHDMILERFPHLFHNYVDETVALKRRCIEAARVCIAISQATADELAAFYPEAASRVVVIHNGAEHLVSRASEVPATPAGTPSGAYVFFVGDRGGYKNFWTLLEALAGRRWPARLGLVVAGPPWTEAEALLLRRLGVAGRVVHAGRVSDAELAGLYRSAAALIVPALVEGFGFPALEAQSFGTPVLCSLIPVFTEVLGSSAGYFDPRRAESIAEAAAQVFDPAWRAGLSAAGTANLQRFRWSRCAELTLEAYQRALA
jgi:glycosyltransferase involved in cell wall biosynthesis